LQLWCPLGSIFFSSKNPVRLQTKTMRKRYGRGKGEYCYKKNMLPFPIKENSSLSHRK
jgi:hypothetical protein